MKKMFSLVIALFIAFSYGEPMESHTNYNVILVHGAGGSETGLDCVNDNLIYEASDQTRLSLRCASRIGKPAGMSQTTLLMKDFPLNGHEPKT